MTELSHDVGEDAFHEIQLSGKQLVFLFMATTVVSVVIFLCGVLVGRGVRTDGTAVASTAASIAGPAVQEPAPPPTTPPAPANESKPDLSYPQTLQSKTPQAEQLSAPPPEPKPEPKPTAAAKTPAPAPVATSDARPPAAPPAATSSAPTPPASTAGARTGTWAVQVVALTDRAAATAVMQRLSTKGYPAFLVNPQSGAPVQNYKVQVGRYNDRAEAEQVKTRLKKEEQFEPWILR